MELLHSVPPLACASHAWAIAPRQSTAKDLKKSQPSVSTREIPTATEMASKAVAMLIRCQLTSPVAAGSIPYETFPSENIPLKVERGGCNISSRDRAAARTSSKRIVCFVSFGHGPASGRFSHHRPRQVDTATQDWGSPRTRP